MSEAKRIIESTDEPVETCRLCLEPRSLKKSHVIPELMYRPIYEPDDHRFRQGDLQTGKDRIEQKGLRERLLCSQCESLLSEFERQYSLDVVVPEEVKDEILQLSVDYTKVKLCLLSHSLEVKHQFPETLFGSSSW